MWYFDCKNGIINSDLTLHFPEAQNRKGRKMKKIILTILVMLAGACPVSASTITFLRRIKMQKIKIIILAACMIIVMNIASIASAELARDIDFVTIGYAGNPADTRVMDDGTTGYGSVNYNYLISKYEITNGQWNTFVADAGAPTGNLSDAYNEDAYYTGIDQPTNNVSWYEAAQFCNYLTSGDKSEGVYQFSGNNSSPDDFLCIDRDVAENVYGTIYFLPNEDEWYKAAYYRPDGSGYSLYANGQSTIPAADNGWNYYLGSYIEPWNVGTGIEEQNHTFDMMGNISEWNETLIGSKRGVRGGSFGGDDGLASFYRNKINPTYENVSIGFRVASVPEPTTLLLVGLGGILVRSRKKEESRK